MNRSIQSTSLGLTSRALTAGRSSRTSLGLAKTVRVALRLASNQGETRAFNKKQDIDLELDGFGVGHDSAEKRIDVDKKRRRLECIGLNAYQGRSRGGKLSDGSRADEPGRRFNRMSISSLLID